MPAKECENGKWKWGETGACKYDSKEEAENDNENYYRDLEDIDLTPTKGMVEAATRGLELRKEFGRGGTEVGVKTARMIISNELTIPRVKKMYAYFQRHEVDKQAEGFELGEDGFPSAGKIAWMLWGDDAGMSWSTKKRNQIENEEKEEKNLRAKVGSMITDGIELPLFDTKEEAEKMAEELGGEPSFHVHILDDKEVYMPFKNHDEALKVMSKPQDEETEILEEERKKITNIWDIKYNDIMEKRIYNLETRVETSEDNKDVVVGYGSVFNSRSENLGGFFEYISPTAITDETIKNSDVRALINHDPNLILSRSKFGEGNLNLSIDETGLKYSYELPDTTYGRDLGVNLKNGNISQSSFAFTIAEGGDSWSTDENGNDIRTINKIDRLFDISSVTYPAYNEASSDLVIAQRGLQKYKESIKIKDEENDLVKRSLAKLKIEIAKRK
tara:strand:+ start:592 stop:1926 length:1335 start_codon:yes stop_codon:yes gene_type:complete